MRYLTLILAGTFAIAPVACSGNGPSSSSGSGIAPTASSLLEGAGVKRALTPGTVLAVALQTSNGDYVTALGGGSNRAQTNCGRGQVALHENAERASTEESFNLISLGANQYALQLGYTAPNYVYITAINGGGMGSSGKGRNNSLLTTNATSVGTNQIFYIVPSPINSSEVAIQTPDREHYITAIAGCGRLPDNVPFHTNASTVGPWETFTLVPESTPK